MKRILKVVMLASLLAIVGVVSVPVQANAAGTVYADEVYRLYNKVSGEHLYTTDFNEVTSLQGPGGDARASNPWQFEGVSFAGVPKNYTGMQKQGLHRLYNRVSGDHHYTSDSNEIKTLTKKHGWRDEGVVFYVTGKNGGTPVYRLYNPKMRVGAHLFTKDMNEYRVLQARHGWKGEGIAFYEPKTVKMGDSYLLIEDRGKTITITSEPELRAISFNGGPYRFYIDRPRIVGVTWYVNGKALPDNVQYVDNYVKCGIGSDKYVHCNPEVKIEAKAQSGYTINGQTIWTFG